MEEKQRPVLDGLDVEKIMECLKNCATGSFQVCKDCPYRTKCDQLILDTIALLETGYDLKENDHV